MCKLSPVGKLWIGYIIAIIVIGFFTVRWTSAEEIKTSWTYSQDEEAAIEGFRIKDKDNAVVVDNIAPSSRTASFDTGVGCGSWYIVAFNGAEVHPVSDPSNIISWCPPAPQAPSKFLITVEQVQ